MQFDHRGQALTTLPNVERRQFLESDTADISLPNVTLRKAGIGPVDLTSIIDSTTYVEDIEVSPYGDWVVAVSESSRSRYNPSLPLCTDPHPENPYCREQADMQRDLVNLHTGSVHNIVRYWSHDPMFGLPPISASWSPDSRRLLAGIPEVVTVPVTLRSRVSNIAFDDNREPSGLTPVLTVYDRIQHRHYVSTDGVAWIVYQTDPAGVCLGEVRLASSIDIVLTSEAPEPNAACTNNGPRVFNSIAWLAGEGRRGVGAQVSRERHP